MVKVHRIHVVIVLASYEFYSSVRYDSEGKERESWNLGPFFIYIFSIFVKNGHHTSCEDIYIFLTYNNLMILIFLLILQHLWQFNLDEINCNGNSLHFQFWNMKDGDNYPICVQHNYWTEKERSYHSWHC